MALKRKYSMSHSSLFLDVSKKPSVNLSFYVRKRRHDDWNCPCSVPSTFHKIRRGTVSVSNITKPVTVIVRIAPLKGSKFINCFISKMISGVDHEAIFHFTPEDNDSTQEYFLRMDKAESQQQRIIIEYIYECWRNGWLKRSNLTNLSPQQKEKISILHMHFL